MSRAFLLLLVPLAGCVVDARYESDVASPRVSDDDERVARPDSEASIEAFIAAATPGEPHARLATMAGRWDVAGRMRMAPGADWTEFTATAEAKSILGGRFVALQVLGEASEGIPSYQGFNLFGYDNLSGEWFHQYLTNHTTSARLLFGREVDDEIVLAGQFANAMKGGAVEPLKVVLRVGNPERFFWREYYQDDDGEEFLAIEVEYTRPR